MQLSALLVLAFCLSFLLDLKLFNFLQVRTYNNAVKQYEEGRKSSRSSWNYSSYAPSRPNQIRRKSAILSAIALTIIGTVAGLWSTAIPIQILGLSLFIIQLIALVAIREMTDGKPAMHKRRVIKLSIVGGILFLCFIFPAFLPRYVGVNMASNMKAGVDAFEDGTVEMFPEIDPYNLRVTTAGIAKSIAETKKSSGASIITSVHLGMYDGELSWMCTVSETPFLGLRLGVSIREIIAIPITDATGEYAVTIPFKMTFSEGLIWSNDAFVLGSNRFPDRTFSRAYPTQNPETGDIVLITTSYVEVPFVTLTDPRVQVWDPMTGDLLANYRPSEAPSWIIQKWDEHYVEVMGNVFGDFRWTRDNDLYIFNGIPYPSDRSADPSEPEGLRYQLWNDEVTAVFIFDNKRNEKVMELLMIVQHDQFNVYAMDHLTFIGADDAKETSRSGLNPPEHGEHSTPLALIYRIDDSIWYHIPIYNHIGTDYYPAYFALVRASDRFLIRFPATGGGMIDAILQAYKEVGKDITIQDDDILSLTNVNITVLDTKLYVDDGIQHVVLQLQDIPDPVIYAEATPDIVSHSDWLTLLFADVGDELNLTLYQRDNFWYIKEVSVLP